MRKVPVIGHDILLDAQCLLVRQRSEPACFSLLISTCYKLPQQLPSMKKLEGLKKLILQN